MTQPFKNRIIAVVLLMVLSLNTVAGFACSIGLDMGYNTGHHQHSRSRSQQHCHDNGISSQEHSRPYSQPSIAGLKDTNGDCCSGEVTRFTLLDKWVADNNLQVQAPVFLLSFAPAFLPQTIDESGFTVNSRFQFVRRSCFLNDTNIQTTIRRFQI